MHRSTAGREARIGSSYSLFIAPAVGIASTFMLATGCKRNSGKVNAFHSSESGGTRFIVDLPAILANAAPPAGHGARALFDATLRSIGRCYFDATPSPAPFDPRRAEHLDEYFLRAKFLTSYPVSDFRLREALTSHSKLSYLAVALNFDSLVASGAKVLPGNASGSALSLDDDVDASAALGTETFARIIAQAEGGTSQAAQGLRNDLLDAKAALDRLLVESGDLGRRRALLDAPQVVQDVLKKAGMTTDAWTSIRVDFDWGDRLAERESYLTSETGRLTVDQALAPLVAKRDAARAAYEQAHASAFKRIKTLGLADGDEIDGFARYLHTVLPNTARLDSAAGRIQAVEMYANATFLAEHVKFSPHRNGDSADRAKEAAAIWKNGSTHLDDLAKAQPGENLEVFSKTLRKAYSSLPKTTPSVNDAWIDIARSKNEAIAAQRASDANVPPPKTGDDVVSKVAEREGRLIDRPAPVRARAPAPVSAVPDAAETVRRQMAESITDASSGVRWIDDPTPDSTLAREAHGLFRQVFSGISDACGMSASGSHLRRVGCAFLSVVTYFVGKRALASAPQAKEKGTTAGGARKSPAAPLPSLSLDATAAGGADVFAALASSQRAQGADGRALSAALQSQDVEIHSPEDAAALRELLVGLGAAPESGGKPQGTPDCVSVARGLR